MPNRSGPFYVIIGLGFSAVLNHRLLRLTDFGKERLGGLPVLHIGMPDPWGEYDIKEMGQWPSLLGLPAFSDVYRTGPPADGFLSCSAFASNTAAELQRLEREFSLDSTLAGTVENIVELDAGGFEISVAEPNGTRVKVIASMIDVCTGPILPNKLDAECISSEELRLEYLSGHRGADERRLLTGEDFLNRKTQIPDGARICVCGGGGIASWCVERALRSPRVKSVLWVLWDLAGSAFPPSRRNDDLVIGLVRSEENALPPKQTIWPRHSCLRLALGYKITSVALGIDGLEATFGESKVHTPRFYVDHLKQEFGQLDRGAFDQIVVAIGQWKQEVPRFLEQHARHKSIQWEPINRNRESSRRGNNFMGGFADNKDDALAKIRILGSASRGALADRPDNADKRLENYEKGLAAQCLGSQIPTGALAIAWANRYFGEGNYNRNINTLDLQDLINASAPHNLAHRQDLIAAINGFLKSREDQVEPSTEVPDGLQELGLDCYY